MKEHNDLIGERPETRGMRRHLGEAHLRSNTVGGNASPSQLDNNPIFYNHKVKVYKGAQKKRCLLEEEAEELNMEGESCLIIFHVFTVSSECIGQKCMHVCLDMLNQKASIGLVQVSKST